MQHQYIFLPLDLSPVSVWIPPGIYTHLSLLLCQPVEQKLNCAYSLTNCPRILPLILLSAMTNMSQNGHALISLGPRIQHVINNYCQSWMSMWWYLFNLLSSGYCKSFLQGTKVRFLKQQLSAKTGVSMHQLESGRFLVRPEPDVKLSNQQLLQSNGSENDDLLSCKWYITRKHG